MQLQPATTWHAPYLALHGHHSMCTPSYEVHNFNSKSATLSDVILACTPCKVTILKHKYGREWQVQPSHGDDLKEPAARVQNAGCFMTFP